MTGIKNAIEGLFLCCYRNLEYSFNFLFCHCFQRPHTRNSLSTSKGPYNAPAWRELCAHNEIITRNKSRAVQLLEEMCLYCIQWHVKKTRVPSSVICGVVKISLLGVFLKVLLQGNTCLKSGRLMSKSVCEEEEDATNSWHSSLISEVFNLS